MITWTADELATFLRTVREDRLYPMWRVSAMTGMRRGEVVGLRWDSVDLGAKTITVQRERVRVRGGVAEGPPKTNRGRRTIDLDDGTVDALVSWAALEVEERVAWGDEYQDGGWVFTWEDGRPLEPTWVSSRFARRSKAAGVPKLRLHDLRDTHATLLLKEGAAPHVVTASRPQLGRLHPPGVRTRTPRPTVRGRGESGCAGGRRRVIWSRGRFPVPALSAAWRAPADRRETEGRDRSRPPGSDGTEIDMLHGPW
jgi:hypothetical protein